MILSKRILVLTVGATVLMMNCAQAGLGWTLAECKQHYGRIVSGPSTDETAGRTEYMFSHKGYSIAVFFLKGTGTVCRLNYKNPFKWYRAEAEEFLAKMPGTTWDACEEGKSDASYSYSWQGTKDNLPIRAILWKDNSWLTVQSKADHNAIEAATEITE
jgi:hypothetical protein